MKTTPENTKSRIEKLKEKHAAQLRALENEEEIRALLPLEPSMVCIHRDHASIHYGKTFPDRFTLKEAAQILGKFTPVESEHWNAGCVAVLPGEINYNAKKENAKMDGASMVEVALHAGKGFDSHKLIFWTKAGEQWLQIQIEISPDWKWLPETNFHYGKDGECTSSRVAPQCIGEDKRRKWWTPPGGYHLSYYWSEIQGFLNVVSE